MEVWKDIIDYEGLYQVSTFGNIKSFKWNKTKILKTSRGKGYNTVILRKDNINKSYRISRLVGIAFIDNPEGKLYIDHIDGNSMNDNIINLRWVSASENNCNRSSSALHLRGVEPRCGKFRASITHNRHTISLGTYNTPEEAHNAYREKFIELYGTTFYPN